MAFLGASMLAIDVGMLMTARNQAQNSADAGALAGATALVFDDYDDRSATGPAVTERDRRPRRRNQVMRRERVGDARRRRRSSTIRTAQPNRVKVTVLSHGSARQPAVDADRAVLRQSTRPTSARRRRRRLAGERDDVRQSRSRFPTLDREADAAVGSDRRRFDAVDEQGRPAGQSGHLHRAERQGELHRLQRRARQGHAGRPQGRQRHQDRAQLLSRVRYRRRQPAGPTTQIWNIANCKHDDFMGFGDTFVHEPGDGRARPRRASTDLDRARIPRPTGTRATNKVVSPLSTSPRVRTIPLFDPDYYDTGKSRTAATPA